MKLIKNLKSKIIEKIKRKKLIVPYERKYKEFLHSDESGVDKQGRENNIVVSLTSYPKRMGIIHYSLCSLLKQRFKPNKIILWLSIEEFPKKEKNIPKKVLKLKSKGLEIRWCEKDIKSYKKLIPALLVFKNDILVTADDDIVYKPDWLEKLYQAYLKEPQYIHCHCAHKIKLNQNNEIMTYTQWEQRVYYKNTYPSFLHLPLGAGGILYPPNVFHQDITKDKIFTKFNHLLEDLWFWAMSVLNDAKINVIHENDSNFFILNDENKTGALWHTNVLKGENDKQLRNILNYYPQIEQKIIAEFLKEQT